MFVQIHMLQSMPPGNLNRDETGQPKKCLFGGVTRGRISSQCLKRNIRLSPQFKEVFGDDLAVRTQYLPRMVADELKKGNLGVPGDEIDKLMNALAGKFKGDDRDTGDTPADGDEKDEPETLTSVGDEDGKTSQLVFFPPPFAHSIAGLIAEFRKSNRAAYDWFIKQGKKPSKEEKKALDKSIKHFIEEASIASNSLTVDIGLFGRMTTSDLVVNVEAACQVAHAISTHETFIESDYFTAMDDLKSSYASTQTEKSGAAYLGSGETETYFNAAVYYKYLNFDVDALRKHLPTLSSKDAARVAGVLINAACYATPTGKQSGFAAHSIPELILVEVSNSKRPLSYANAFLQPVEGGTDRNLMTESAKAMKEYVEVIAAAFSPADMRRVLLAVGPASVESKNAERVGTLDDLIHSVTVLISTHERAE
ncbi:MAG: type I-E CRISPR-associated protein Cas7/Cse4/CasC [Candidatus Glassbacteria bacterium]